jgi:hypothetical protein
LRVDSSRLGLASDQSARFRSRSSKPGGTTGGLRQSHGVETAVIGNGGNHWGRFLVEHTGFAIEPPLIHVCVATFATPAPIDNQESAFSFAR